MTISDLVTALRAAGACLYLDAGLRLRYVGPKLAADDPIRPALAEYREELRRLYSAPA